MTWVIEDNGEIIPLSDELGKLLNCAVNNKDEVSEIITEIIDNEILEDLKI